jgi:hypothetical protein
MEDAANVWGRPAVWGKSVHVIERRGDGQAGLTASPGLPDSYFYLPYKA